MSALSGSPMWRRTSKRKSCEIEGKADAKSSRMHAPAGCVSEVIMLAVSSCNRLRMIERLDKKPCWRGRIQLVRCSSQRLRAALATMRLSQFTMLSGRVLLVVYASVPSLVVVVLFLGRHTKVLWLYWWVPSLLQSW